jgi:hypothetical protein
MFPNMKKIFLLFTTAITFGIQAQQVYCDHEGVKLAYYGYRSGILDSTHANPMADAVNPSSACAKYIRDTMSYDNIRIYPNSKLVDVTPYDFNSSASPKIRLKLFSTAPVGTIIKLQLGAKTDNNYPSGVHSEFTAATNIKNAWQQVTFTYSGIPSGSMVASTNVDKIVILFNPGSNAQDTIYIDDLSGPELVSAGIQKEDAAQAKLFQNSPNPARETSRISFQVVSFGMVSLKLYDIVGNQVGVLINEMLKPGTYSIPIETTTLPNGVYFYTLEAGESKRSMKMIISN